jgi:thioredoxin 2
MDPVLDDLGVVVTCAACGRGTRLRYAAIGRSSRCGHCKGTVTAPAVPLEVPSRAVFDAAEGSTIPLVVDFWAPWCGPCRFVAPELEKLARSHAARWLVVKVNTDQHPELAARYRIQSIPTLAVVRGGREIARLAGARPAADIERFVEQALERDALKVS